MTEKPSPSLKICVFLSSLILALMVSACSSGNISQPTKQPDNQLTLATSEKILLPSPQPSSTPTVCSETTGKLVEESVDSEILGEEVSFKIYLPPCYDYFSETQFSVLYMLHGQTSLDDQWVRIGLLWKMDELLGKNLVKPFLIVLPNEENSNTDAFRSEYGDAIVADVIPFVEENYSVCLERNCRAIGGLSRGGNWAIHLGFEHPELFGAVGAHSAPLFYGEISNIYRAVEKVGTSTDFPNFYIDVGDRDADLADVTLFLNTLQELNIPHKYSAFVGYHDEAYWSEHVEDYLKWYDLQLAETQPFN